jgi:hypothetical protein
MKKLYRLSNREISSGQTRLTIRTLRYWTHQKKTKNLLSKSNESRRRKNNIVSDAETYLIDEFWLLFIYYITGGGSSFEKPNNTQGHFVFPELYQKESGSKGATSAYIFTILKKQNFYYCRK